VNSSAVNINNNNNNNNNDNRCSAVTIINRVFDRGLGISSRYAWSVQAHRTFVPENETLRQPTIAIKRKKKNTQNKLIFRLSKCGYNLYTTWYGRVRAGFKRSLGICRYTRYDIAVIVIRWLWLGYVEFSSCNIFFE